MNVFAKYEMTTAKREPDSPILSKRKKFILKIEDQIALIKADQNNEIYTLKRKKWVTDQDGERRYIEQPYTPKKWYWQRDGRYVCQLKYGSRVIYIANKHNAILVDDIKDVHQLYLLFKESAIKGDFDNNITLALSKTKKK